MDWEKELYGEGEQPLDRLVDGYSYTSIFRKIAFIGDSLSSGEFESRDRDGKNTYKDMFEHSWGQHIARKNGLTAYNFSRGGMTAKWYMESFAEEKGFWNPELAAPAYVIALGYNDLYGKHCELGSFEDIDINDYRNNKPSFYGQYAAIIAKYKEISPDAKFFLVTFCNYSDRDDLKEITVKMVEALYKIASIFDNTYVIDLYKYGPEYDRKFKDNYFMYGHMTPTGYVFTAKMIDSYIDYIIRHNQSDFKTVGYIGTDIYFKGKKDVN